MNDEYQRALASIEVDDIIIVDVGEFIADVLATEITINDVLLHGEGDKYLEFDIESLLCDIVSCIECKNDAQEACIELTRRLFTELEDELGVRELQHRANCPDVHLFSGIYEAAMELMAHFDSYGLYQEDGCSYLRFREVRHIRGLILEKYLDVGVGLIEPRRGFNLVATDSAARLKRWALLYS